MNLKAFYFEKIGKGCQNRHKHHLTIFGVSSRFNISSLDFFGRFSYFVISEQFCQSHFFFWWKKFLRDERKNSFLLLFASPWPSFWFKQHHSREKVSLINKHESERDHENSNDFSTLGRTQLWLLNYSAN